MLQVYQMVSLRVHFGISKRWPFCPFERHNQPTNVRAEVDDAMLNHMRPTLTSEQITSVDEQDESPKEDGWAELSPPQEEPAVEVEEFTITESTTEIVNYESSYSDERAALEAELAKLDAKTSIRQDSDGADDAMSALEAKLGNLDLWWFLGRRKFLNSSR